MDAIHLCPMLITLQVENHGVREGKSVRKPLQGNIAGLLSRRLITMCCSESDLFNSETAQQPSSMAEDGDFFFKKTTNPTAV